MVEQRSDEARWIRRRAARVREIAAAYKTEVSPLLEQMAREMEEWADDLERRR